MEISGKWYLKSKWFGYIIMIQIKTQHGAFFYRKATRDQIFELGINCL